MKILKIVHMKKVSKKKKDCSDVLYTVLEQQNFHL